MKHYEYSKVDEDNPNDFEPSPTRIEFHTDGSRFEIVTDYGPENIEEFTKALNAFLEEHFGTYLGWFSADLGPFGFHGGVVITSE